MQRFSLRDLTRATGGRLRDVSNIDACFDRVFIDSREVQPGSIFWALKGEHLDGHHFTGEAHQRGAHLSVVAAESASAVSGAVLIVDNPLTALGRFAAWHRHRLDPLVIGITGSVGKTTTRELTYAALGCQFQGIRSRKNYNNLIGLPLSLLELNSSHEFAVIEMGASRVGDIRELCDIACPEIGIVTAVGPAHLESFGSLAAVFQAKGELLEQLPTTGFAVLPGDDPDLRQMADRAPCPVIFVGQGDDNHIQATQIEPRPGNLRFHCEGTRFDVPVNGRHAVSNALCAIGVGLEIGIPIEQLASGLARFSPPPGRGGLQKIGPWTVLDDTYNASPLSVAAACHALNELAIPGVQKRMLVLGDMRELGSTSKMEHERIGRLAAQLQIDRILVCGEFADDVARGAIQSGMNPEQVAAATHVESLLAVLNRWLEPNDILLVKGSRSTRMERVIEWLNSCAEFAFTAERQQKACA
ncbi:MULTISPECIES: UDP-N-acetylmuramoyl-tripeptide--D-alanyl-D-alanine ligase [unclassified Schlesneria]|uniref:UDP-N-acetylmuramoyl-tripeptide--D-alanyl-D- alanine ligase n=1 Tax=Schlesneria TaxID=656899 RepID=UPI002F0D3D2E